MKSPADMKIIMIEMTNACHKSCSNCTRFCGEHPRPFFMDIETFKKAVDSMAGFGGIVGLIGGEPTLHPQFEEMVDYYAKKIPEPRPAASLRFPVDNFQYYHRLVKYMRGRKRGLFSSLGAGYYKNFEQIQDVFPYQSLNDHRTVNTHQAILVTRKELGIPDEEWYKLRDNCWIQNLWSASITPKGAFFCEIAASLDMLFDGPGGWPIEAGWWKRKPSDFGEQLNWCEMCSIALKVPTMNATEETDIVSPLMLEKLKRVNGPKIRSGKFVVLDTSNYDASKHGGHKADPIWYLPQDQRDVARISPTLDSLYPRRIDVFVTKGEHELVTLNLPQIESLDFPDWVAVFQRSDAVSSEFLGRAARCVLNPGFFYRFGNEVWLFNRRARALKDQQRIPVDNNLVKLWDKEKRAVLNHYPKVGVLVPTQKLRLLIQQALQRGAFLMPVFRPEGHMGSRR